MDNLQVGLKQSLGLEIGEGGFEEVFFLGRGGVDEVLVLHPLVEGLALDGGFGRDEGALAEGGCHFFVDAVGLPLPPADFEERVFCIIEKRE